MDPGGIFMVDLDKALHMPGCPICNIKELASSRYFRFFLHENVNDVSSRIHLHGSWGFCKRHAWQCQEMELKDYQDGMKHGILYEWLLQSVLKNTLEVKQSLLASETPQPKFWPKRKSKTSPYKLVKTEDCPACISEKQSEELYLEILVTGLSNAKLLADYSDGDGLCLPHCYQAMNLEVEKEHILKLCELQIARLRKLTASLTSYVAKHDYQNTEPYTQEELDSWEKAVRLMVGNKD